MCCCLTTTTLWGLQRKHTACVAHRLLPSASSLQVDERQRGAVIQMEELKLAAVAQLDGFDLALIPHINSRNSLHIVGLKVGCNTDWRRIMQHQGLSSNSYWTTTTESSYRA